MNYKNSLVILILFGFFILSYSILPLYSGNQNVYQVKSLFSQNVLEHDWYANTLDPVPNYTILSNTVTSLFGTLGPWAIYLFLVYIFFVSILFFAKKTFEFDEEKTIYFGTIIVLLYSSIIITVTKPYTITKFLTEGLAAQYILQHYLEPAMFGILFLPSILFFLNKKRGIGIILATIPPIFHSGSIVQALFLLFSYFIVIHREKKLTKNILFFIIPLIVFSGIYFSIIGTFGATKKGIYDYALHTLIWFRIPQHSVIDYWVSLQGILKVLLIPIAIYLVRKKEELFVILTTTFILGLFFSIIQYFTLNDTLALFMPWRISTILIPLSSIIILGWIFEKIKISNFIKVVLVFLIVLTSVGGMLLTNSYIDSSYSKDDYTLKKFFIENIPDDKVVLVPLNFQEFRLDTGQPIYVDEKAQPYKDVEFLEWYRRYHSAKDFYANPSCSFGEADYLVLPVQSLDSSCEVIYRDLNYVVVVSQK